MQNTELAGTAKHDTPKFLNSALFPLPYATRMANLWRQIIPGLAPTLRLIQQAPRSVATGKKRYWVEDDHSPTSSVEVKNWWSFASSRLYALPVCRETTAF
jgi:hypothetical protein